MEPIIINIIVIAIVAAIIAAICYYLYKQKKRGVTCIGCPYANQCAGKCGVGCGGCNNTAPKDEEKK